MAEKTVDILLSVDIDDEVVSVEDLLRGIDQVMKHSDGVRTWGTKDADKIFKVAEDEKCGGCNWRVNNLYLMAKTEEEAREIYKENDRGLCADCLVELIIDTHGGIITVTP